MTNQEYILDLMSWESTNGFSTVDLVKECFNCHEAEIESDGSVWIANPQTGHVLSDDELAGFVEWHKSITK